MQALTPGCDRSKTEPFPRTSTPLNAATNRRTSGPRPQFITPYRKQEANREVSPLVRCSSSKLPVSDSMESQSSGIMEPTSKKPRISAHSSTLNTRNTHYGDASKVSWAQILTYRSFGHRKSKTDLISISEVRDSPITSMIRTLSSVFCCLSQAFVSNPLSGV